jgi:hypothetical protein
MPLQPIRTGSPQHGVGRGLSARGPSQGGRSALSAVVHGFPLLGLLACVFAWSKRDCGQCRKRTTLRSLQVRCSAPQSLRVVAEQPQGGVALVAEQSAEPAGGVAVIDAEVFAEPIKANRAQTPLFFQCG